MFTLDKLLPLVIRALNLDPEQVAQIIASTQSHVLQAVGIVNRCEYRISELETKIDLLLASQGIAHPTTPNPNQLTLPVSAEG